MSEPLVRVDSIAPQRWPRAAGAGQKLAVGPRMIIEAGAAKAASLVVLGFEDPAPIVSFLSEVAPDAELLVITSNTAFVPFAKCSAVRLDAIDQLIETSSPETAWDMIVDAGQVDPAERIDCLFKLSPCLKPHGIYVLIDDTVADARSTSGSRSDILEALYSLGDILIGHRLRPSHLSTTLPVDLNPAWPAATRHDYVRALFEKIEIVDSGAVLHRGASITVKLPAENRLTAADLASCSRHREQRGSGTSDAQEVAALRQKIVAEQRTVAVLRAELQRLAAGIIRRDRDIAALNKEREQLGATIERQRRFRPHRLARRIATAPRSLAGRAKRWSVAKLRQIIAIPRVRNHLLRVRNQLLR